MLPLWSLILIIGAAVVALVIFLIDKAPLALLILFLLILGLIAAFAGWGQPVHL